MSLRLAIFNGLDLIPAFRGFHSFRRAWLRRSGIQVGAEVRIPSGVRFYDRYLEIADGRWIGPEVTISSTEEGKVHIGACCDIAPGVLITSGTQHVGDCQRRAGSGTGAHIWIGDGTRLGAGSIVIAGARIGAASIVAAGSVAIAGDHRDNVLLARVPAVVKRVLDVDDTQI